MILTDAIYGKKIIGVDALPMWTYYPFNDDTTEVVQGLPLIAGNVSTYAEGINGKAAVFTGSNYLHLPNNIINPEGDGFTISMWAKGTASTRGRLIELSNSPQALHVELNYQATNRLWTSVAGNFTNNYNTDYDLTQWFHICMSINRVGSREIYINGNLIWSAGSTEYVPSSATPANNVLGAARNFTLAAKVLVDGFGVYDVALTPEQAIAEFQRHQIEELM